MNPGARAKRYLYLIHRWTGIVMCVLMALWFASGMVMLFVGYCCARALALSPKAVASARIFNAGLRCMGRPLKKRLVLREFTAAGDAAT